MLLKNTNITSLLRGFLMMCTHKYGKNRYIIKINRREYRIIIRYCRVYFILSLWFLFEFLNSYVIWFDDKNKPQCKRIGTKTYRHKRYSLTGIIHAPMLYVYSLQQYITRRRRRGYSYRFLELYKSFLLSTHPVIRCRLNKTRQSSRIILS